MTRPVPGVRAVLPSGGISRLWVGGAIARRPVLLNDELHASPNELGLRAAGFVHDRRQLVELCFGHPPLGNGGLSAGCAHAGASSPHF